MLEEILRIHAKRYPLMKAQDAVKLIYQSEFGGGHMIRDPDEALRRLKEELFATKQKESPLCEDIGEGFVRVQLCAVNAHGLSVEKLNGAFVASACHKGDMAAFFEKLKLLKKLQREEKLFGFSLEELEEYLRQYGEQGYPAVSHSSAYREAYTPAYRVVKKAVLDEYVK